MLGALLLAPLIRPVEAQQETGFLNRVVSVSGRPVRYQVYVPVDFTPERRWPVILFLHGGAQRGTDGVRQTQTGLSTAVRQHPDWFPAIVVLPQAPEDSLWLGSVAETALAALEQSVTEFRGDRSRLYLTGLSLGGYGVWALALKRPTTFAAIVAVCGGLVRPRRFTQQDIGLQESDPYRELARRLTGTPVWLFHGALDSTVSPQESRRIYGAFRQAGSPVKYTEYPGIGHNSWDPAFSDLRLWRWLLQQRKGQ
jgi:predicted peptidase